MRDRTCNCNRLRASSSSGRLRWATILGPVRSSEYVVKVAFTALGGFFCGASFGTFAGIALGEWLHPGHQYREVGVVVMCLAIAAGYAGMAVTTHSLAQPKAVTPRPTEGMLAQLFVVKQRLRPRLYPRGNPTERPA